jgi:hypothetical protein
MALFEDIGAGAHRGANRSFETARRTIRQSEWRVAIPGDLSGTVATLASPFMFPGLFDAKRLSPDTQH